MKGILLGLLIAAVVLSCMSSGYTPPPPDRGEKMTEITALWTQIRQFRADMDMPLDPGPTALMAIQNKSVTEVKRVCPDNHHVPKPCEDHCTLSGHICENAELICKIADELGKHDRAQEKCTSAKASCREAKQKCCNCSAKPPVIEPVDPPAAEPGTP